MYNNTITVTSSFTQIFNAPLFGAYTILIDEQEENFNSGCICIEEHGNTGGIKVEITDLRGFKSFTQFMPATFTFDNVRFYFIQKIAGDFYEIKWITGSDINVNFIAYYNFS